MAGTKRRSRAFWEQLVRAWHSSGMAREKFAKRSRVNPNTLSWWACKLRAEGMAGDRAVSVLPFVEVSALAPTASERIELEVAGATIRVPDNFDAKTLARVLEVLASR